MQIAEEISSPQQLHDNLNVILTLEDIVESNDAWVLAYFQNFDLTFKELKILEGQVFLLDNLDCDLLFGALVNCILDNTVLTFPQVVGYIVKVVQVAVSNGLLDGLHPLGLLFLGFEVIDATLVRENQHEGEHHDAFLVGVLLLVLNVNTAKRLHFLVLNVTLVLVTV